MIGAFSNGVAFALTASVDAEDVYGASIPLSIAAYDRDAFMKSATNKQLPRYFMAAGELESFVVGTKDAAKIVEACKVS